MKIVNIGRYFAALILWLSTTILVVADKIAVTVDNSIVTQSELEARISALRKHDRTVSDNILRQQVLDDLINETLLLNLAGRMGIKVDKKQLDVMVTSIAKGNGMTLEQLREEVIKRENISFEEFRQRLRKQALIHEVQRQILGPDISIDERDIIEVQNNPPSLVGMEIQYQLNDIVFTAPENVSKVRLGTINKLALELAKKLNQGVNVRSAIAKMEKQLQPGENIVLGDDMGWRRIDELPELFAPAVAKLKKVGQTIGPIIAPNGLHLLQLREIKDGEKVKLSREQASDIAYSKKIMKKMEPFLRDLRSKAYIKIN